MKNILSLVWRVEMDSEGIFVPTWPVLMTTRDIVLKNLEPMEIGLQYSWKYWQAALALKTMGYGYQHDLSTLLTRAHFCIERY